MRSAIYAGGNTMSPVDAALTAGQNVVTGIAALAGGAKSGATALTGAINSVDTVTTAADSVILPAGVAGLEICVINTTANAVQVFGAGTDTINAVATATGVSQAAGKTAIYFCTTSGTAAKWFRLLSA